MLVGGRAAMGRLADRKPVTQVPGGKIGYKHGGHGKWTTLGEFSPEPTPRIRRILRRPRIFQEPSRQAAARRAHFSAITLVSVCRNRHSGIASGMLIRFATLKVWLPPMVWMVVIFSASGDSASHDNTSRLFEPLLHWLFPWLVQTRIEDLHYLCRKCGHLTEFGLLALLLWQAIRRTHSTVNRQWQWSQAGLALAIVLLYAASDEIHQTFVPGRTGQLSDVIVDTTGGALGLGLLWLAGKIFKRW